MRGLADFEIPELGLRLRNCVVSDTSVIQWIDLPASRGRTRTAYLVEFANESKQAEFNEAARPGRRRGLPEIQSEANGQASQPGIRIDLNLVALAAGPVRL